MTRQITPIKHRITSIANAIAYFQSGTKVTERKMSDGGTRMSYEPPRGFIRMNVTKDTGVTYNYDRRFWFNYVNVLREPDVVKIVLYYED